MELRLPDVQDVVYQKVDGVSEDYDKLKQRILAWAANKVANSVGPVPTSAGYTIRSRTSASNRKMSELSP